MKERIDKLIFDASIFFYRDVFCLCLVISRVITQHSPCLNCGDREIGCHSKCEKYIMFRRNMDQELEVRHKAKEKESEVFGYIRDRQAATYWGNKNRK